VSFSIYSLRFQKQFSILVNWEIGHLIWNKNSCWNTQAIWDKGNIIYLRNICLIKNTLFNYKMILEIYCIQVKFELYIYNVEQTHPFSSISLQNHIDYIHGLPANTSLQVCLNIFSCFLVYILVILLFLLIYTSRFCILFPFMYSWVTSFFTSYRCWVFCIFSPYTRWTLHWHWTSYYLAKKIYWKL
jgi:hypothetical protein